MDRQTRMKVDEEAKDWISHLPTDIIHSILSLVPLREAVRTSVLSHKWRDLWKTMPDLDLSALNVMGTNYSNAVIRKKSRMTVAEKKVLQIERYRFIRRVEQVLMLQISNVHSFRIQFNLDITFSAVIDSWLQTAITKKAKKIDINLAEFGDCRYLNPSVDRLYTFPERVFSGEITLVEYLSLSYCICKPPPCFNGLSCLRELRLETVCVSDEHIGYILSNSSRLERLSLINCWKLENLTISGTNLVLKYLNVAECYSLSKIELDAANLITFAYYGTPVGLAFQNTTQLVNSTIYTVQQDIVAGVSYALGTLSTDLPQLKSLLLHAEPIERRTIPERLPEFSNLKQLVLMVSWMKSSLFGFFSLLQSAPYLERFELHLPFEAPSRRVKKIRKLPACTLLHLKEIVLSGLVAIPDVIDFVTHLVSKAEVIKTVRIFAAERTYEYETGIEECSGDRLNRSFVDAAALQNAKRMSAAMVGSHVQKVLPPGAKLIINDPILQRFLRHVSTIAASSWRFLVSSQGSS